MLSLRSLRIAGCVVASVFLALAVVGADSTGVAVAAVVTSDDPVTSPSDVVTYTDANGQQHTIKLPASPKTTVLNPSYNTATQPVILPREMNALEQQCADFHASGNTPAPAVVICGALNALGMAGSALGFQDDWLQAPLNWLFPTPAVDPGVQNPAAVGCPPGRCLGGYVDKYTRIWYADPSEGIGWLSGSVSIPQSSPVAGATYGYNWRIRFQQATNNWTANSPTYRLMCSTGTTIATGSAARLTGFRPLADYLVGHNQVGYDLFEMKVPGEFILTASQRTAVTSCYTGGGTISQHLEQSGGTLLSVFLGGPGIPVEGTLTSKVTCTKSDGSTVVVENSLVGDFRPGERSRIPDAQCPPDSIVTEKQIDYDDGTGSVPIVPPTATTPSPGIDQALENMDCYTGKKVCKLELKQTDGVSCGPAAVYCPSWASDPNAETKYKCTYGGTAVTLNTCSGFRAPTIGILPNTDDDGNPIPYTAPVPDDLAEVDPEDVPRIGEGGQSDTPEGKQCFPTGWAVLNPVEWVMKPVGCALETAFVPSEGYLEDALETATEAWSETAPYKVVNAVAGWSFVPPPAGCGGITVDVFFLGPPFQVMDACPGSMLAPLAALSRLFCNIAFAVYGVVAVTRNFAKIFGFVGVGESA